MSSRTTEFRLLALAAVIAALVPRLAQRGMFLDGVTYASIARNLAERRGHFWTPYYTDTIYPEFHEHPPLGFWLQSLWFRLFGDHLFVERLYSASAAAVIAILIASIWRSVRGRAGGAGGAGGDDEWLPILLWIAVPVVSWTIVGNLLETTMCVFVMLAVAAITCDTNDTGAGLVSGIAVVGAVLSKGPVGLFPLAAPVIAAVVLPHVRRRMIWRAVAQWTTVTACAAALTAIPAARESLSTYINQQVVAALEGRREVSGSPFTIIVALVEGVWLQLAIVALAAMAIARGWTSPGAGDRRRALAFTLVGLAGTLPIALSPKQTGHYLMPAVPFYALGAAALLAPTVNLIARRVTQFGARMVRAASLALIIGALFAARLPVLGRDAALLADLDAIDGMAPRRSTIGMCPAANSDWMMHAWFQRRFRISLDASRPGAHEWFVKSDAGGSNCPPAHCAAASDPTRRVVLMQCR